MQCFCESSAYCRIFDFLLELDISAIFNNRKRKVPKTGPLGVPVEINNKFDVWKLKPQQKKQSICWRLLKNFTGIKRDTNIVNLDLQNIVADCTISIT